MDYPFIGVAGLRQNHSAGAAAAAATRPLGHTRSSSSITPAVSPRPIRSLSKSPSTSVLSATAMAADLALPRQTPTPLSQQFQQQQQQQQQHHHHHHHHQRPYSQSSLDDSYDLSTIPDPRSRAMSPANSDLPQTPSSSRQPDLNDEVATLSVKLINAINHQTTLGDTLSATRLDLDHARAQVRQLEDQLAQQREMLAGDVWVRRKTAETEKTKLLSRVAEEKKLRHDIEDQKTKMEQELENLTAALFEEANKMVVTAKEEAQREHDALQRRNDQLKGQLADTEGLLKSQQEQLAALKQVMEQMSEERDGQLAGPGTVPSSPGLGRFEARDDDAQTSEGVGSQSATVPAEPVSPSYPTSFTQLLQPVLRTDLTAYEDFKALARTSKRLSGKRMSTGSQSGISSLGVALGGAPESARPSNASNASLSTLGTPVTGSTPQTPNTPASTTSAISAATPALPPLKDTKFFKRALAEDVEPTLRLDIAPGLSWLARRAVLNAMTDGTLVVEPVIATTPAAAAAASRFACALCGEARRDTEQHLRSHRFRTSESDSAQRYPLCRYCLGRVRSTCDFLGFLRILKDGHWRADDEDAERAAWEESVRLREQMFWSRVGGGVVPAGQLLLQQPHQQHTPAMASPATAAAAEATGPQLEHRDGNAGAEAEQDIKPVTPLPAVSLDFATLASRRDGVDGRTAPQTATVVEDSSSAPAQSKRDSAQSLDTGEGGGVKRLSLTIPPPTS